MEAQPTEEAFMPVVGGNGILGYTTKSTFTFPVPLVTCRGSKCGLMQWAEPPTWVSNNAMAVYFKGGFGDNFFLYQYLLQSDFDDVTTGSAQPQITVSSLALKKILLPAPNEQTAIAQIMGAIEEKIQVNREISETLEAVAQTIFKSWFTDFDPVKAKMTGEKPVGMDDATAALFPDSMEDSALGQIPIGWSVQEFGEVNHLLMGQSPPGDTYNSEGEGVPFYQGRTDFGTRFPKQRVFCTAGTRFARAGEVLISVRAPVGDLNQAIEDCVIGRGVASAMHKNGSQAYSYSLLCSLKPRLAYYNGEGTVFGAINRADFYSLKIVEPPRQVVDSFETIAGPLNDEIRNLFIQTESLIELRDSLLPRLISGKLQIPEEMLVS
jgi:type I restriction enzyme S subunit